MEFEGDEIVIEKPSNDLDELVLSVSAILERIGVQYSVVSGYVAVLFGRARSTEDIDVVVERFDEQTADEVAAALEASGFWGSAMPLDALYETLADDLPFRVARSGDRVPNVELKFPTDEYDRTSLENALTVRLPDGSLRVGSLELQIAYKLGMGAKKDFEDALHLYRVTGSTLNTPTLVSYVNDLEVQEEYDRLRSRSEAGS